MDYKSLGFRCGLECHQQLDGKKLFCNCPCEIKDTEPDFTFKRNLRASASELGEVDKAALHELGKGKYFVYQGYKDVNCLVEIDEEPPKEVNEKALNIALTVALLLNCKIVDKIEFMRKVVIDGSNVSGFQRTGLIGINGYIETSEGKIKVASVCLEEEAAKKVDDNDQFRVYNISRLGIPLIEIATDPDIKSPEGAKEAAEKIGMILRSIEGVKRGLGTIRQDVNVSISKGARTEIKGFQDFRNIPKVINNEIERQLEFIQKGNKVEEGVRKAEADFSTTYLRPMPGAERMYPETDVKSIVIDPKLLKSIKLPELIFDKIEKTAENYSIEPEQARELVKMGCLEMFEKIVSSCSKLDSKFVAETIISLPKEFRRKYNKEISLDNFFIELMKYLNDSKISKNSLLDIYLDKVEGKEFKLEKYQTVSGDKLEEEIKLIVEKNKGAPFNALMGEVMRKFVGKVDGKKAAELIKKYV